MRGLHLTADLHGCRADPTLLVDPRRLAAACEARVDAAGLRIVARAFHAFPAVDGQLGGVTGAVLLAESHLALHTWPERGEVTLDVYVCHHSADNSARAARLMSSLLTLFDAAHVESHRVERGTRSDAHDPAPPHRPATLRQRLLAEGLLVEWDGEDALHGLRVSGPIETIHSAHQCIEVFDSPRFGPLFCLDGGLMSSVGDEFFYHEPLVHAAAISHPAPRRALIIGGGDGGSAEELLKHPEITEIVLVELDAEVVDMARRHLRAMHHGALDDPRVRIVIEDGARWIERPDPEGFDLVLLDLTDPDSPARELYTEAFFQRLRRRLNPGGALSLHVGSPLYQAAQVRKVLGALQAVFEVVRPMHIVVPLYGGSWCLAIASPVLDPAALPAEEVDRRLRTRAIGGLRYYNDATHGGLFALPGFVRACVPV